MKEINAMKPTRMLLITVCALALSACMNSKQDDGETEGGVNRLTADQFNALPAEDRYAITNKLLTTLYKGVGVDDYFDLTQGLAAPVEKAGALTLVDVETQLATPLANYSSYIARVDDKYFYDNVYRQRNTRAYAMATLWEMPLSRDYFNRWIAYQLANNILFSPAGELDSVSYLDVGGVFNNLSNWMDEGKSIPEIVYAHMISQYNWRRFRSPEDNTREMMEIYLMRFKDEEVPLASQACQNWSLGPDTEDYQLKKSQDKNTESLSLLDTSGIISCEDFYRALVQHPSLIPAVTARIVDQFFPTYSAEQRAVITADVVSYGVTEFSDIFEAIIFSDEYLLRADHVLSAEQLLYGTGHRIDMYARRDLFHSLNDDNAANDPPDLVNMKQASMSYKLGRLNSVPADSLSFAYVHKLVRNNILMDRRTSTSLSNTTDGGWQAATFLNGDYLLLSEEDRLHYLFLRVLGRKASSSEIAALQTIFGNPLNPASPGNAIEVDDTAVIVTTLDYFSRLPELYVHRTFSGGQ